MRKNYDLSVKVFGRTYQPIENNTINHKTFGRTIQCRYEIYKDGRKWNLFIEILTNNNTILVFLHENGSFKELNTTTNFQQVGYRPVPVVDIDDEEDLTNEVEQFINDWDFVELTDFGFMPKILADKWDENIFNGNPFIMGSGEVFNGQELD